MLLVLQDLGGGVIPTRDYLTYILKGMSTKRMEGQTHIVTLCEDNARQSSTAARQMQVHLQRQNEKLQTQSPRAPSTVQLPHATA